MNDVPGGLVQRATWPVRTDRLLIRPATIDDAPASLRYRSRPDVARWLPWLVTDETAYAAHFAEPHRLGVTLMVERDAAVVGDVMLRQDDPWAQGEVAAEAAGTQAELGWSLDPAHTGLGLATEAVAAVLDVCFGELGLRRVVAHCFADNTPSWRLMERLGMRREQHTVRDALHRDGRWLDGYGYAILADEWKGSRTAVTR